jgi:dihydrofolate synthase / folylpolyglutamate synthase
VIYEDYLEIIYNALPMYQREGKAAYKADLRCTLNIDAYFNHPHHNWQSIHVAGTNGKGSVSHMLASVLYEAGYKTGLYTSPHMKDFRERIRIDGEMISISYVMAFMDKHMGFFRKQKASFFEMTVAMAFEYFKQEKVDIVVVETGMGGRLDSTNIVTPLVSVITNIGYDHTAFLGNTLSEITLEKAGIIKPKIPVVLGTKQKEVEEIVKSVADEKKSRVISAPEQYKLHKIGYDEENSYWDIRVKNDKITLISGLHGDYQGENIATVLSTIDELYRLNKINHIAVKKGLANVTKNTGITGRWQKIDSQPDVFCDVAHNREGLQYVIKQLETVRKGQLYIVLGMVNDKLPEQILPLFPGDAYYFFTQANVPRAMPADRLAEYALKYGLKGEKCDDVRLAYHKARKFAKPVDTIFIGGSTFIVAEVL